MKAESIGKTSAQTGLSTLELIIAMAILVLNFTAIILVTFGNQSQALDASTSEEALNISRSHLEEGRAQARENFVSVNSFSATTANVIDFRTDFSVSYISPCLKQANVVTSWNGEFGRQLNTQIVSDFASVDIALALGADCATSGPSSPWDNPNTLAASDLIPGGNEGRDIDVAQIGGKKYAFIASYHTNASSSDFWIFDITNASTTTPPTLVASLDTGYGLNAIDVARNNSTGNYYAYTANDYSSQQLQIINLANISSPVLTKSCDLPSVTGPFPQGRSLFFLQDKIYLGTHRTGGSEFHIYNVSNPSQTCAQMHKGNRELNHNINKIVVNGNYAYLANSGNQNELAVLNISNPSSIQPPFPGVGNPEPLRFDAPGDQDGTALSVAGNRAYLGRAKGLGSEHDFFVLDISNLSSIFPLGSVLLNLNPSTAQVSEILVSDKTAFLGTSDSNEELQIWNIADPANIVLNCSPCKFNFSAESTGLDFLDNFVYSSVKSNDALHIIYDNNP